MNHTYRKAPEIIHYFVATLCTLTLCMHTHAMELTETGKAEAMRTEISKDWSEMRLLAQQIIQYEHDIIIKYMLSDQSLPNRENFMNRFVRLASSTSLDTLSCSNPEELDDNIRTMLSCLSTYDAFKEEIKQAQKSHQEKDLT